MKEIVLQNLKTAQPGYLSGEQLSIELNVSRTAVWKCIKELKEMGYEILSSSKKGYLLLSIPDAVTPLEISSQLNTEFMGKNIIYFDSIDSTNIHAKRAAMEGCPDGTLVIAECQTAGRGRLGRNWASVGGKGIWMSIVLRPDISPEDVQLITLAASAAVVEGLEEATGIQATIKWPNDIIICGKKACGILVEMSSEMERVNYLVLGMGMNVSQEYADFPEDLQDKAISLKIYAKSSEDEELQKLFLMGIQRSKVIGRILFHLEELYQQIKQGKSEKIIEQWKKHSVTLGKDVVIYLKNERFEGMAQDITTDGKLIVACTDGRRREISSGEVSVRGLLGYI